MVIQEQKEFWVLNNFLDPVRGPNVIRTIPSTHWDLSAVISNSNFHFSSKLNSLTTLAVDGNVH